MAKINTNFINWFPQTEEDYKNMSYDETCLIRIGKDSEDIKEKLKH